MNRPLGILFYKLKGSPGWSKLSLSTLDIARIVHISHRKRLFRIFDWDKPYKMEITYFLPYTQETLSPTIVMGGRVGATLTTETHLHQYITKRYSSEEIINRELKEIRELQYKLDKYNQDLSRKILSL